jgi:hypothetical protein
MDRGNFEIPGVKLEMDLEKNRIFQQSFFQEKSSEHQIETIINHTEEVLNDCEFSSIKYTINENWIDIFNRNKNQILKFIESLKNNASHRKINIPENQLLLLDENYESETSSYSIFKSKYWLFSHLKIVHPLSNFKFAWDFIHFLSLTFMFFFIPFEISFYETIPENFPNRLYFVLFLFYIVDIVIILSTGFYEKGEVIFDRYEIICNFFRNRFLIDFCGLFPYFYSIINKKERSSINDEFLFFKLVFFFEIPSFYRTL